MKFTDERRDQAQTQSQQILNSADFSVGDNIKSEYDMWSWIFQEVANIRMEVSRLGTLVRVNNSASPGYLDVYHAHIYSFLLPVSVVISDDLWDKIYQLWLKTKSDILKYYQQKNNVMNLKIPFALIQELDGLYRIALLAAQRAGLGFKVSAKIDTQEAISKAIAVSN
jgi:hypothetical protein